jgi:CBS domain containing-hemolysin-like protein
MIEEVVLFLILALALSLDLAVSAARAALLDSSYARLVGLREELGDRINRALSLYQIYPRALASLNLVLVLMRFLLAGWVLYLLARQTPLPAWWVELSILLAAALILFSMEHGVASSASNNPERSFVRFSRLIRSVVVLASPFTALPLTLSKDMAVSDDPTGTVTEDELKTLVDAGQEEGVFEQGERQMIYSIMELGDTLAREIMAPRIDMLALDVTTPLEEAIDTFLRTGHSRVPVYEETIDNTLGLLYAKDLLQVWREGKQLDSLRSLLRPAYYIPEAKKVNDLLKEMQSQRIHMAIVVDEYGGIAGLVTLEDIIEEILGEIRDEYDQAEELPYQVMKNGDTIFLGRIDLDDFNETMGSRLPKDEADTLGGYIYSQLGHVPEVGEMVTIGDLRLVVEQVSARRIRKVRARWAPVEEKVKEENNHANG